MIWRKTMLIWMKSNAFIDLTKNSYPIFIEKQFLWWSDEKNMVFFSILWIILRWFSIDLTKNSNLTLIETEDISLGQLNQKFRNDSKYQKTWPINQLFDTKRILQASRDFILLLLCFVLLVLHFILRKFAVVRH